MKKRSLNPIKKLKQSCVQQAPSHEKEHGENTIAQKKVRQKNSRTVVNREYDGRRPVVLHATPSIMRQGRVSMM